jgi:septum formation protein
MSTQSRLILASASEPRKRLLSELGLSFDVIPSQFNESDHPEKDPKKRALALGELKAKDVAALHPHAWVIGCDTLVSDPEGRLMEKPHNREEAEDMLRRMSGRISWVHSGLAVIRDDGTMLSDICSSPVTFKKLTEDGIQWWLDTPEHWQGRSGAFQIDGPGQLMIEHIEGDWTNIVGLPIFLLGELFQKLGSPLQQWSVIRG